ncbi:hypothetical protein AcW1_007440 [Taiwanofungus camphoratus]|nr:hypothetical protein AcW2_007500 [Antrodia cinnamomea]KAI0953144.1 hypothetical protein AcW1_007440 [Antrodia cinnamomea]
MRAHVEVDEIVGMSCLDVGLKLREEFKEVCEVQIAAFAQDPLFASAYDDPSRNFRLLHDASKRAGVQAVGSAPYVESSTEHAKRNIMMIFDLAYEAGLHVDFHLDYNLDPASEPLIWHVLEEVRERMHVGRWNCGQHVCVGHATRLTLFSTQEWTRFSKVVRDNKLPITLVGLPPSDMYMMGKNLARAPRSTLDIPRLSREFGLKVGMAINNIGNAFTPQGPVDPLALCPLGVAVFQAGIQRDCRSLIEAVTLNAKTAIGLGGYGEGRVTEGTSLAAHGLVPTVGDIADFVVLHDNDSMYSAALNPSFSRTTIKNGVVIAQRFERKWIRHSFSELR